MRVGWRLGKGERLFGCKPAVDRSSFPLPALARSPFGLSLSKLCSTPVMCFLPRVARRRFIPSQHDARTKGNLIRQQRTSTYPQMTTNNFRFWTHRGIRKLLVARRAPKFSKKAHSPD